MFIELFVMNQITGSIVYIYPELYKQFDYENSSL